MTAITDTGFPTLAHLAALMGPDQRIVARVANLLSKKYPILDRIPWFEGNLPTGHLVTQAANSLPTGTWRSYNAGVVATNPETQQFIEACGLLEDWSKIDVALAAVGGDPAAYRMRRDDLKVEGLGQQLATALLYESATTNPQRIHGLTPRYPGTSGYTASSYTLAGTNAGVNAQSVWLMTMRDGKLYGIYPHGSQMGLVKKDLGEQVVTDSSGASFLAYMTQIVWNCGFVVEDYRHAVRSQWDPDDASMADEDLGLVLMMQNASETIFEKDQNTFWLMSRTSKKKLRAQLAANDKNLLSQVVLPGRGPVDHFDGMPILVDDSCVAETAIS